MNPDILHLHKTHQRPLHSTRVTDEVQLPHLGYSRHSFCRRFKRIADITGVNKKAEGIR